MTEVPTQRMRFCVNKDLLLKSKFFSSVQLIEIAIKYAAKISVMYVIHFCPIHFSKEHETEIYGNTAVWSGP